MLQTGSRVARLPLKTLSFLIKKREKKKRKKRKKREKREIKDFDYVAR